MPSPTAKNGRASDGKFGPGNKFASGNPLASKVQKFRDAFLSAVTEQDVTDVVVLLVNQAKAGDLDAIKILFDRVLGKTTTIEITRPTDEPERLISGEVTIENFEQRKKEMSANLKRIAATA